MTWRTPACCSGSGCAAAGGAARRARTCARRIQVFESCGAVPFAERARAELLATGEHVRKRAMPAGNDLTAQERQVAILAAGGQHQRRDSVAAVHHRFHRGVPPEQGVPEARNLLAQADRRADSPLSRAPGRCGMIGKHDGELSQAAGADARVHARGTPGLQVSPDGQRVTFLRSQAGDDPVTCLWELNRSPARSGWSPTRGRSARTRRTCRRRSAPGASGSGRPPPGSWPSPPTAARHDGRLRALRPGLHGRRSARPRRRRGCSTTQTPALDPRLDPAGTKVAYVHDGALRVVDLVSGEDAVVAKERRRHLRPGGVRRRRGDGPRPRLLVVPRRQPACSSRGSTSRRSRRWYIADPANPDSKPDEVAYPAAGTANADVSLLPSPTDRPEDEAAAPPRPTLGRGRLGPGRASPTWSPRPGTRTC